MTLVIDRMGTHYTYTSRQAAYICFRRYICVVIYRIGCFPLQIQIKTDEKHYNSRPSTHTTCREMKTI